MRWFTTCLAFFSIAAVFSAGPAQAGFISGTHGLNNLGKFNGTVDYTAADAQHATLTITLANITDPKLGGYITAFAFNNPGDAITAATLSSSSLNFGLLGAPHFDNGVNGAPFGRFDLGAGTGGSFEGGGKPSLGIAPGGSETFTFSLQGVGLNQYDVKSFLVELSSRPGNGEGNRPFVARFRGFACEPGSDKVPLDPGQFHHFPEPSAVYLAATGVACLVGMQIRRLARRT